MSSPTAISHRERLLREGMRQLYERGFHGTSVDGILAASGVPKGSFYHHFGSKDAFVKQILARYMQFQLDRLEEWCGRDDLPTPAILSGYFREMADRFVESRHRRACLAGKLSTELAAGNEAFRAQLSDDFAVWKGLIRDLLLRGRQRGDVRDDQDVDMLADAVLAMVQGAFVVALASHDDASLTAVRTAIDLLLAP